MKKNIQKTFRGLTCLALCAVLVLCSIVSPVLAVTGGTIYDIGSFFVSSSVSGEYEIDEYVFGSLTGSWFRSAGSDVAGFDDTSVSYSVTSDLSLDYINFTYFPFGSGYSGSSMQYNYLDVSYYAGRTLSSFLCNLDFAVALFNTPVGLLSINWQLCIMCYDHDMNYLEVLTAETSDTKSGGSAVSSTLSQSVDLPLSSDTFYIVPYLLVTVNPAGSSFPSGMKIEVLRKSALSFSFKSKLSDSGTDSGSVTSDCISGYDVYGELAWKHVCTLTDPDCMYHLEVVEDGYYIRCDCGWWYRRYVPITYDENYNPLLVFLGLDTDNDEFYDLMPGQSKDLPSRAGSDLRPYLILEFFGPANQDTPTVTIRFVTKEGKTIEEFTFDWCVEIFIETYGIVLKDYYGYERIYYVDYDFLLYDVQNRLYLGEDGEKYASLSYVDEIFRHVVYEFTLEPVGEGHASAIEWVIYIVRSICDSIYDLFTNFFGLKFIFTDDDSPFKFLMGG